MNLELLDPFAKTVPDHVDSVLTYGVEDATVCCFDRRGTYLAVGYTTGVVVIWDFITRGIGRVIEAHARAVTALSWAGGGRRLLSASHDHRLHLWALDQPRPELVRVICFDKPVLSAMMLPRNFGGAIALTADGIAYMVDIKQCTFSPLLNTEEAFGRNSSGVNPGSSKKARPSEQGVASRSVPHSLPGVLCMELDRRTRSVSLGTANGRIISVRTSDGGVSDTVSVVGCSKVTQMDFSRDGKWMLVNSGERVIRMLVRQGGTGKSVRDFQDVVNRTRWQCCRFTGDSEYVAGGSKAEADCSIYIWSVGGHLVTRLEGPQVTLRSLARHPVRPFLAAAMDHGKVQLWGTTHTANWTAFAADFEELEENVEYVEKEDEFDVVVAAQDSEGRDRKAAEREKRGEEVIVSIDAIDTVAAWSSDSDAENGTPFYLSTEPGAAAREGWYDLEIQTSKGRKVPQQKGRGRNELQEDDKEEWKTVRVDRRQVKKPLGVEGVYESIGNAFAGDQGTLHNAPPVNKKKKKKRPVADFPVEGCKGQKRDRVQSSSGGSKSNSKIEKRVNNVHPRAGGGSGGGRGRVGEKLSKSNKHQGKLGEGSSSSRAVAFSSGRPAGDKRQERALAVNRSTAQGFDGETENVTPESYFCDVDPTGALP